MDPRGRGIIHVDANALDLHGSSRDDLVRRFNKLRENNVIRVVVPHGVRNEALHPKTPTHVKNAILPEIFTIKVELTQAEQETLRHIQEILRGEGKSNQHNADGKHIFEASKNGGFYFITEDSRILKKRDELHKMLQAVNPALRIVTLKDFFEIFDRLPLIKSKNK